MPFYNSRLTETTGSKETSMINKFFANGKAKKKNGTPRPQEYGARLRAAFPRAIVEPNRLASKAAFRVEAPARETAMGSYFYQEGRDMRGRAKAATSIFTGKASKRFTRLEANLGDDIGPVDTSATYYQVPQSSGAYLHGLGQITPELFKRDLETFSSDVQGFNLFTTNSQERRIYEKGRQLIETGKAAYGANATAMAGLTGLAGELNRWLEDRQYALVGVGSNQFDINKIRTRMINAINYLRTAIGLAATNPAPSIPQFPVPIPGIIPGTEPGDTGTPKPQAPAAPVISFAQPTWFERNKVFVLSGVALALGVGGYVWWKSRK